jgi:hypothetical protein
MDRYEYMRIPIDMIPTVIMDKYNLRPLIHKGFVFVKIRRGMYGLPQAGRLANDQLIKHLGPHGYAPLPLTPGLWHHKTRDIVFSLVVDDFEIRYTSQADADHLLTTLETFYQVSRDWSGARYCGHSLAWDYSARSCDISMPGYIERALKRFQHSPPRKPEHSPHPWLRPNYGAKTQFAPLPDSTPALDAANKTRILEVLGTLLFYARAIDSTLLTAIGELATEQSQATTTTMNKLAQLLNYCATHPDASVRFTASDMILAIESDASYLTSLPPLPTISNQMAPSISCAKLCVKFYPALQRPNSEPYSTMEKKLALSALLLRSSAIHNLPLPWRRTITLQVVL